MPQPSPTPSSSSASRPFSSARLRPSKPTSRSLKKSTSFAGTAQLQRSTPSAACSMKRRLKRRTLTNHYAAPAASLSPAPPELHFRAKALGNLTQSISRDRRELPHRQSVALIERCFHIVVFQALPVSLITAAKRLKAETPRSGYSSADRSLA